jgi:hypothetical protein
MRERHHDPSRVPNYLQIQESPLRRDPFTSRERVRICTRFVPEGRAPSVASIEEKSAKRPKADARTRTGDPFITSVDPGRGESTRVARSRMAPRNLRARGGGQRPRTART